jgi:hypothetical protein
MFWIRIDLNSVNTDPDRAVYLNPEPGQDSGTKNNSEQSLSGSWPGFADTQKFNNKLTSLANRLYNILM